MPELPKNASDLQRLADQLKKVADQQQNGAKSAEQAQKMRQRAEEMLRKATPEQRRQLEELARRLNSGQNTPPPNSPPGERPASDPAMPPPESGEEMASGSGKAPGAQQGPRAGANPRPLDDLRQRPVEAVDARSKSPASGPARVISELERSGDEREGTTSAPLESGIREAVKGAERALEQHNVPQEHRDLVRRVFQRYVDRAAKSGKPVNGSAPPPAVTTPPPPPAKDL